MGQFVKQLWARKVVQFGAVYLGAAWVLVQAAALLENTLHLPDWVDQTVLILLALGFPAALILAWAQESNEEAPKSVVAVAAPEQPAPSLGVGKPSIAVLPFVNMSADAEHEHFADGMTEDIITGLSFSPYLSVKSRTSTFVYKGHAVDIRKAAADLQVHYVVEGSIRPVGTRIRITVQLIEAVSGDHIWAENYDKPRDELFDVQDEVIAAITAALGVHVIRFEAKRANSKPAYMTSWELIHRSPIHRITGESFSIQQREMRDEALEALKRDPNYAYLHSAVAMCCASMVTNGWAEDVAYDLALCDKHLQRALTLAPDDPYNLNFCAGASAYLGRSNKAIRLCERALEINPNYVEIHLIMGLALAQKGRFEEASASFRIAESSGLQASHAAWCVWYQALARIMAGDFDSSGPLLYEAMQRMPGYELPVLMLAVGYGFKGNTPKMAEYVNRAFAINPHMNMSKLSRMLGIVPDPALRVKALEDLRQVWPADKLPARMAGE